MCLAEERLGANHRGAQGMSEWTGIRVTSQRAIHGASDGVDKGQRGSGPVIKANAEGWREEKSEGLMTKIEDGRRVWDEKFAERLRRQAIALVALSIAHFGCAFECDFECLTIKRERLTAT